MRLITPGKRVIGKTDSGVRIPLIPRIFRIRKSVLRPVFPAIFLYFSSLFYLSAKAVIPNALPIVRRCDMPAVFTYIDNLPY